MNLPAGDRKRRRRLSGAYLTALVLCLAAFPAPLLQAQELVTLRQAFEAARSRLDAEIGDRSVAEGQWLEAIDSISAAKARDDGDALSFWYAVAEERSGLRSQAVAAEAQAEEALETARQALRAGLNREIARLEAAFDTARGTQAEQIELLIAGNERELVELDRENEFEVRPAATITIDPIDGPEDILAKSELLDRAADRMLQQIRDIDDRLEDLRNRLRRKQRREDARRSSARFDDDRVPVGTGTGSSSANAGDTEVMADSLTVRLPRSLEEEIRGLEELRAEVELWRNELLGLARSWRALAGGTS